MGSDSTTNLQTSNRMSFPVDKLLSENAIKTII